jgi:phenylpropionate dioxygenase-like ring-hydroxylating dioxygenase large terminal subunit
MTGAEAYFSNSDATLRQFWHPVAVEAALPDSPHQVWLLDEPWVLVQLDGELVALRDQCPHRLVPLSEGRRVGNRLERPAQTRVPRRPTRRPFSILRWIRFWPARSPRA